MEIERKYLIKHIPEHLDTYPHDELCQAYVSTSPVIRVRQKNDDYILTVKSAGMMERQEFELALTSDSFHHLLSKKEGMVISKTRYKIPDANGYTIELDFFHGVYKGLIMAEVEFPSVEEAKSYNPPAWFGPEVTCDQRFFNSNLCMNTAFEVKELMDSLQNVAINS